MAWPIEIACAIWSSRPAKERKLNLNCLGDCGIVIGDGHEVVVLHIQYLDPASRILESRGRVDCLHDQADDIVQLDAIAARYEKPGGRFVWISKLRIRHLERRPRGRHKVLNFEAPQ